MLSFTPTDIELNDTKSLHLDTEVKTEIPADSKSQETTETPSKVKSLLQQLPFFNDAQLAILKKYLSELATDNDRISFADTLKADPWSYNNVANLKLFRCIIETLTTEEGVYNLHEKAEIKNIKPNSQFTFLENPVPLFDEYTKKYLFQLGIAHPATTPNTKNELNFLKSSESFFHGCLTMFGRSQSSYEAYRALKENGDIEAGKTQLAKLNEKVLNFESKFKM